MKETENRGQNSSWSSRQKKWPKARKRNKLTHRNLRLMGLLDIITGEMLLVPGVEAFDSGRDDVELRVGGKAFAHIHRPDRIDVRLPQDVKENVLGRGIASRSPEPHDREGWVSMKLGENADLPSLTRLLHQSYRFTSSML